MALFVQAKLKNVCPACAFVHTDTGIFVSYCHVPFSTKQFEIKNTSFKYILERVPFLTTNTFVTTGTNPHVLCGDTQVFAKI